MPRLPATALACLALAGAAVAGCGSDNKSTSSTPAPPPPAASTTASAATSGDVVKVSMKNIKFVPHDITAKVGQKIMWTNDDQIAHTVTATSGANFDSGAVNGGATFEFTATKAGKIDYVCTIHAGQNGTITVTK
jgi:plastocyanin